MSPRKNAKIGRGVMRAAALRNGGPEKRFYWELGYRIRVARDMAKMTQGEIARKAGITRTSYCNLEAGRQRSPLVVIARIALALDVKLTRLIPELEGSR